MLHTLLLLSLLASCCVTGQDSVQGLPKEEEALKIHVGDAQKTYDFVSGKPAEKIKSDTFTVLEPKETVENLESIQDSDKIEKYSSEGIISVEKVDPTLRDNILKAVSEGATPENGILVNPDKLFRAIVFLVNLSGRQAFSASVNNSTCLNPQIQNNNTNPQPSANPIPPPMPTPSNTPTSPTLPTPSNPPNPPPPSVQISNLINQLIALIIQQATPPRITPLIPPPNSPPSPQQTPPTPQANPNVLQLIPLIGILAGMLGRNAESGESDLHNSLPSMDEQIQKSITYHLLSELLSSNDITDQTKKFIVDHSSQIHDRTKLSAGGYRPLSFRENYHQLNHPNNQRFFSDIYGRERWNRVQPLLWNTSPSLLYQTLRYPSLKQSRYQSLGYPSMKRSNHLNLEYPSLKRSAHQSLEYPSLKGSNFQSLKYPSLKGSKYQNIEYPSLKKSTHQSLGYPSPKGSYYQRHGYPNLEQSMNQIFGYPNLKQSGNRNSGSTNSKQWVREYGKYV